MSGEDSGKDKRRYKRVHFRGDVGQAQRIIGARLVWSNQETSDVFDLSFKGFAVSRPGLLDLKKDALESIQVELGERRPFRVVAKVVWLGEQRVGLELGDISPEAHLSLNEFLNSKLIGENLVAVDRQFFSVGESFNYWFRGPNETHLFVWCDPDDPSRVVKIVLELTQEETWEFENRRVTFGEHLNEQALQILGQLLVTQFRLRDVIEKVAASA